MSEYPPIMVGKIPDNANDEHFDVSGDNCSAFEIINDESESCISCLTDGHKVLAEFVVNDKLTFHFCISCLQSAVYSMLFKLQQVHAKSKE